MLLISELLRKPAAPSFSSRYTALNGLLYLGSGALFIVWPGAVQVLFMEPPFVGHEGALFRVVGLTLCVIGWLYLFGGRSGARQFVAASVFDRLILVPLVLVPLAIAGIFPHVDWMFAVLDPALGIGAWTLLNREAG